MGDTSAPRDIVARCHLPDARVDGAHAPLDIGRWDVFYVLGDAQVVPTKELVMQDVHFSGVLDGCWCGCAVWVPFCCSGGDAVRAR